MFIREKQPTASGESLNQIIEVIADLDLSNAPSIADIFSGEIELQHVEGIHVGLISSPNLYPPESDDSQIKGIWLQGIDETLGQENGRIMEHDHASEGITEIIVTEGGSVYAGLPAPTQSTDEYKIYVVPAGTRHGSDETPSYGWWVSMKYR